MTPTGLHDAYGGEKRTRRLAMASALGRPSEPEEAAEAVLWLLSDRSFYVTGTLFDVAGET